MPDERTPLIQVVRVGPERQRYSHSTIRRFCTIALGTTLIIVVILFIIPISYLPHHPRGGHRHERPYPPGWPKEPHRIPTGGLSYDELIKLLKETPSAEKAREWSQYYTSGPTLTGKNYSQAAWTLDRWEEFGVSSKIVTYETFISYPRGHRIALLKASGEGDLGDARRYRDGQEGLNYTVEFECSLEEDVLEEDPTTGLEDRVPTFHGYSASGNVTAQYVYANYGMRDDYMALADEGIELDGKIALVRYGEIMRGMKVKLAQDHKMAGVIMYSDPGDDYGMTEENGFKAYPEGRARNPSSVQRGTVNFLSG